MNVVVSFIVNLSTVVNHFPSAVTYSPSLSLYLTWPFLNWHAHTRRTYLHTFQYRSVKQIWVILWGAFHLHFAAFKCLCFIVFIVFLWSFLSDSFHKRVSKRINRQTSSYWFDLSGQTRSVSVPIASVCRWKLQIDNSAHSFNLHPLSEAVRCPCNVGSSTQKKWKGELRERLIKRVSVCIKSAGI